MIRMMAIAAVGWLGLASASDVTIELTDGGADVGALLRLPMPAEILKAKAGQVVELTDEKGVAVQAQVECAGTEGNGLELVLVRPAGLGKRLKVGNVSSPNLDGLYTVTKEGDQTVALCAGQKLMAVYRLGVRTLAGHPEHNRANFFYPLLTPAGAIVNDDAPADHLHHRGLFLAFTELTWAGDGKQLKGNFWHKDANAVIAPGQLHYARGGPVCATLAASHDFMIGGQTVVVQDVIARAARVSDRVHVLDVEYRITPKNGDVVLGENFYSCLQLRGAANFNRPDLVFSYSDGIPHRDVDKRKEQPPEDPPFERWLDETGLLNGSPVGTAIAVHPSVPKSRLCYSRGVKGLNLDFLYNGPMLVKAGETVRARYQVYLHDGTAADARIGDLAGWFNPGIEANWKK